MELDTKVVAHIVRHAATTTPAEVAAEFKISTEHALDLWVQATSTRALRRPKTHSVINSDAEDAVAPTPTRKTRKSGPARSSATSAASAPSVVSEPAVTTTQTSVNSEVSTGRRGSVKPPVPPTPTTRSTRKRPGAPTEDVLAAPSTFEAPSPLAIAETPAKTPGKPAKRGRGAAKADPVVSSQEPLSQQVTSEHIKPVVVHDDIEVDVAEPCDPVLPPAPLVILATSVVGSKLVGGTPVVSSLPQDMSPPMFAQQVSPLPSPAAPSTEHVGALALPGPSVVESAPEPVSVAPVPNAKTAPQDPAKSKRKGDGHASTTAAARVMKGHLSVVLADIAKRTQGGASYSVFGGGHVVETDPEAFAHGSKKGSKRKPKLLDAARKAVASSDHFKQNMQFMKVSRPPPAATDVLSKLLNRR